MDGFGIFGVRQDSAILAIAHHHPRLLTDQQESISIPHGLQQIPYQAL